MQRNEFSDIDELNNILLVQKFLINNIAVEINPSFEYLSDIFRVLPEKSDKRRQIDGDSLSFEQKWNNLANNFMNADDFIPENIWAEKDSRLENIDPRVPPTTAWTGEQLRTPF